MTHTEINGLVSWTVMSLLVLASKNWKLPWHCFLFHSCSLLAHLMSHDVTCLLLTLLAAGEQVNLSPVQLNMHEQYIIHSIKQMKFVTWFKNNAKIFLYPACFIDLINVPSTGHLFPEISFLFHIISSFFFTELLEHLNLDRLSAVGEVN